MQDTHSPDWRNDVIQDFARSELFERTFQEGMELVEETAAYLDGGGRQESKLLSRNAALAYAAHGASVILLGRTESKLEQVYDQIEAAGWPKPALVALDLEYFTPKGREVMEKVFWKNSLAAYRWKKRRANQPSLT